MATPSIRWHCCCDRLPNRALLVSSVVNAANQPGNSNAGHDYGNVEFSPDQRKALIEYLKSL